ncbi:transposable element Tc1 transposase [Trichonephila clavipes]|nr:transposable element Tc1 transposase [Trichonephila clavipes]
MQTRWHHVPIFQHSRFEMASPYEQAQTVAWFTKFKSAMHVQRKWITTILKVGRRSRKISIAAERRGRADRKTNQEIKRHLDAFTRVRIIGKLEEGRSVTNWLQVRIARSIVSRLWRQFQTTGTTIRGFSSGRPRRTTPADVQYIVLQARRNRRYTAVEIARHTTQATGQPISHFTVARRLHGGGLFAQNGVYL